MKKSKKKILLIFSLIAIISCSGSGGGGGGGSTSASTPTAPSTTPGGSNGAGDSNGSNGTGGSNSSPSQPGGTIPGPGAGVPDPSDTRPPRPLPPRPSRPESRPAPPPAPAPSRPAPVPAPPAPPAPTPPRPGTPLRPGGSRPGVPSISTAPRLTTTDWSRLPDILNRRTYEVTGEGNNQERTRSTHYDVEENKIGFEMDSYTGLEVVSPTTMNVKTGGIAFKSASYIGNYDDIVYALRNNIMGTGNQLRSPNNLTVNMQPNSYLFMFDRASINLSELQQFNNLDAASELPAISRPTINGTGYKSIIFSDSYFSIDQNVNLDSTNDIYYKIFEHIRPDINVQSGITISGTRDNQIGIHTDKGAVNNGIIDLKGNNSVGIYADTDSYANNGFSGKISVKKNSTGIYVKDSSAENSGIIDLGESSIGIYLNRSFIDDVRYSAHSRGQIKSTSNNTIGMAANIRSQVRDSTSYVEPTSYENYDSPLGNWAPIKLTGDKSIGMFATGDGKYKLVNNNTIEMGMSFDRNNPSIGMYSNNPNAAIVNNVGIRIGKNSVGMAGVGTLVNETNGEIQILSEGGIGMYLGNNAKGINKGLITTFGSAPRDVIGVYVGNGAEFSNEGTIRINSEGGAAIVVNGGIIRNYGTIEVSGGAVRERNDNTRTINVLSNRTRAAGSDLGVYVDTQGRTRPIEGLSNLRLNSADLLIGPEATEKTNATEVTVDNSVLEPFNNSIQTSGIRNWNVKTGSLVWEAESEINNNRVEKVTLKKQSYTKFADSEISEGVAKGLDEKYTETSADSKDKQTFNYLNTLSDRKALAKTYREINGSQYVNIQQRVAQTSDILDGKLSDLQKENADKSGHHVSTFFNKDKYESRSEEIADTNSSAYGVAYMFNNADAKQGIYAGTAINTYKFKDNGKSKENVTMFKLGAYKTFDLNNIEWTLSGDGFVSQNDLKRRFIIGNDIYENRADYNAYGFAVRNELGKTFRIGKNVTIKPYAALKLGYGRFSKIREKDGTMAIEISGNDYYSIKPMAGLEFGFAVPVSSSARFTAILGLGYEHELGKVENNVNEARFINGTNSWKLRSKKEEVRGNLKTDIKAGFEAGNFGVYLTGGHNTKGKNSHVGVNLGVSF